MEFSLDTLKYLESHKTDDINDLIERLKNKPDPCLRYSAEDDELRSEAAATITALHKRVEELEGALEQFVPSYQSWMDKFPDHDNSGVYQRVTWGQIRRARALLCAKGGSDGR